MPAHVHLDNIAIVLQRPRYPENIGAAVRAMRNMGIGQLIVVEPRDDNPEKIMKMATHACLDAVQEIRRYDTLQEALKPFSYVVGTTARLGKQRRDLYRPEALAKKMVSISSENPVALVFGPEDRGLTNEDLRYCHDLVNIPTADFTSINLAQSVMIMCYALFTAAVPATKGFTPRLANRHELDAMYEHLKDVLIRVSFLNPQNPEYWLNNLRQFFSRMQLRAKDVKMVRGICRQVDWYAEKRYRDGLEEARKGFSLDPD